MTDKLKGREYYETETREWLDSLDYVLKNEEPERVQNLFRRLQIKAQQHGVQFSCPGNTPYMNSITKNEETPYPGSREIERRLKSIIRWNAMAMVTRANRGSEGIGGHISTYASAATLWEVGFNHFFRGADDGSSGDMVFFQGHASPGVYARAFLEGRLEEKDLINFRQELRPGGGLPSYPHPRLMPDFWQFPTVSMGLASIMAIYQARFNQYMEDRGLKEHDDRKVWAFVGDGEMDEPESLGAITLAAREELENLIFVVNCNRQRLDGPVRGNSKIMQELEAAFKGAGWNVLKVVWGSDWDPLFEQDDEGLLLSRLEELTDGQYQKFIVEDGAYIRKELFGSDERLLKLVENYSDEQLKKLHMGGHDPVKVYNAYQKAVSHKGSPTVILAQTVKGYGLGEAGEGKNVTHKQKKLNEEELRYFRGRFGIPISDEEVAEAPFYKPAEESEEMKYLLERRKALGGFIPRRNSEAGAIEIPDEELFKEFYEGSGDRDAATTMVIVRILSKLLKDEKIGRLIVPIVPDESRTFGMESLFRSAGIYSHAGQNYEPVDKKSLLFYNEKKDGAILEEGITEAGSLSSFIAAGTSYSSHGMHTIPFFIFYSMFGFQRVGDLIWAAADARSRGFLVGGTSGRTSLAGEGLQHQDGQSHLLALSLPNLKAYDPTFAYEVAAIVTDGLKRMFVEQEDLMYYITVLNETYPMPSLQEVAGNKKREKSIKEGILKGIYLFRGTEKTKGKKVHLFGSGAILRKVIDAARLLEKDFDIPADVYSVTSWKELYMNGTEVDRWNLLHPDEEKRESYLSSVLSEARADEAFVAATDYLKALPLTVSSWLPSRLVSLGTDGFGRSDNRKALRDYFEVDERYIALAALGELASKGHLEAKVVSKAFEKFGIDPEKQDPAAI